MPSLLPSLHCKLHDLFQVTYKFNLITNLQNLSCLEFGHYLYIENFHLRPRLLQDNSQLTLVNIIHCFMAATRKKIKYCIFRSIRCNPTPSKWGEMSLSECSQMQSGIPCASHSENLPTVSRCGTHCRDTELRFLYTDRSAAVSPFSCFCQCTAEI